MIINAAMISPGRNERWRRGCSLFFLVLLVVVCFFSTPGVAKEGSTVISFQNAPGGNAPGVFVQNALEYAKDQYDIDILVNTGLLHEQVAPWNDTALPANKWAARVFKSFDKIVYYNSQGRIESIKVIGLKGGTGTGARNHVTTSDTQVQTATVGGARKPLPASDVTFFSPTDTRPKEMEEMVIDKATGDQQPPEGVTIYSADEPMKNAGPHS
jgi:hypothetical protein